MRQHIKDVKALRIEEPSKKVDNNNEDFSDPSLRPRKLGQIKTMRKPRHMEDGGYGAIRGYGISKANVDFVENTEIRNLKEIPQSDEFKFLLNIVMENNVHKSNLVKQPDRGPAISLKIVQECANKQRLGGYKVVSGGLPVPRATPRGHDDVEFHDGITEAYNNNIRYAGGFQGKPKLDSHSRPIGLNGTQMTSLMGQHSVDTNGTKTRGKVTGGFFQGGYRKANRRL